MSESRPTPPYGSARLPQRVRQRPHAWLPGELLVAVHVDLPSGTQPDSVLAELRASVGKILGDVPVDSPRPDADPPLLIPTQRDNQYLLFAQFRLRSTNDRAVKDAVERLNRAGRGGLGNGFELVAATPNWFGAAQQDCQ